MRVDGYTRVSPKREGGGLRAVPFDAVLSAFRRSLAVVDRGALAEAQRPGRRREQGDVDRGLTR